jgi:hypothetical protein
LSSSTARLNLQAPRGINHGRREISDDQLSSYNNNSQNDVRIEEYDGDANNCEKQSRENSIRFVMLKDDVMFENPDTPALKAALNKHVN